MKFLSLKSLLSMVAVIPLAFTSLQASASEEQLSPQTTQVGWTYGPDEFVMKVRDDDGNGICIPITDGTDWGQDLEISMVPTSASAADFKTVSYDGTTLTAADWTDQGNSLFRSATAGAEFIVQIKPASGDPNVNYGWPPVGTAKPGGCDDGSVVEVIQWGNFIKDWVLAFRGESQLTTVPNVTPPNLNSTAAMFINASNFNSDIGNWDMSNVTDTSQMFRNATSFDQNLNNWDVSKVSIMTNMFRGADSFNSQIGDWNVSSVTDFRAFMRDAVSFNQPMGNWNVGNAVTMRSMFHGALAFNQDIGDWDVRQVNTFSNTFTDTDAFDQDLSNWEVSEADTFREMFDDATAFSRYIGDWDVSSSATSNDMFRDTPSYNFCFPNKFLETVDGGVADLGKPSDYQDSCMEFSRPQFSAPQPFQGPVITSMPDSVRAGEKVVISGTGLESITEVMIDDSSAEVVASSDNELQISVSENKQPGEYYLKLITPTASVAIDKPLIVETEVSVESDELEAWTKRISDTQAKVYVKNPVGKGKVQVFVNGEEIAWIRAENNTDPKLRMMDSGPMAGVSYLVRTIELTDANRIAVELDGEQLLSVRYNR